MSREELRFRLPYAAGLQLIHASLSWDGAKSIWISDCEKMDAKEAEERARMAEVFDSATAIEPDDDALFATFDEG